MSTVKLTQITLLLPTGWYTAEVQSFNYDDDEVQLVFEEEPESIYSFPVLLNLVKGRLRLKQ